MQISAVIPSTNQLVRTVSVEFYQYDEALTVRAGAEDKFPIVVRFSDRDSGIKCRPGLPEEKNRYRFR